MSGEEAALRLWLFRHGETPWSAALKHTGRTDVDLTPEGEEQALALAPVVKQIAFSRIYCSPRLRARRTADLAGLVPYEIAEDLSEWDYGDLEGLTSVEIARTYPGWTIWDGPWPGGESPADVASRADRLISGLIAGCTGEVALVGHGHFSRVLAARWVGAEVAAGRWLELGTASWCKLGWDRGTPVVVHWNVPALGLAAPGGSDR